MGSKEKVSSSVQFHFVENHFLISDVHFRNQWLIGIDHTALNRKIIGNHCGITSSNKFPEETIKGETFFDSGHYHVQGQL